jgi:hypothetical protein
LTGVAVLMTGAVVKMTLVAVIGFLAMLAAAYVFISQWRRSTGAVEPVPSAPAARAATRNRATAGSDSFMDRMEERWRKRRDETG